MKPIMTSNRVAVLGVLVLIAGCAPGPPLFGPAMHNLLGVLFLVALVGIGMYVVRNMKEQGRWPKTWPDLTRPSRAEDLAKERYARGELTREEYVKIIDDLRAR